MKLTLPITGDAGHSNYLARCDIQAGTINGRRSTVALHLQLSDAQDRIFVCKLSNDPLDCFREVFRSDHHLCKLGRIGLTRSKRSHISASTENRDAIGVGKDLLHLVRDENDRMVLIRHLAHCIK